MTDPITGLEKNKIARSFLRGKSTYDEEAVVQQKVNERLLALLRRLERFDYQNILEIGCCTGMLTEMISKSFRPAHLFVNDLVPEFYDTVVNRLDVDARTRVQPYFGDIEKRMVPTGLDLIISTSTLQWLSDLEGFFDRILSSLVGNGIIAFSMFGQETFSEITELTGTGLNYPSFDMVSALVEKRFRLIYKGVERDQLFFTEPGKVLRHIQATGVGGVGGYTWTPRRIEKFARDYRVRFGTSRGMPLSYVSYTFIGEKVS